MKFFVLSKPVLHIEPQVIYQTSSNIGAPCAEFLQKVRQPPFGIKISRLIKTTFKWIQINKGAVYSTLFFSKFYPTPLL